MRRLASGIIATLLLTSMLTLALNIQTVEGSGTIYIRPDGSVDPPTAPIQRDGDVYTFTDNISNSIVVERSNITIDGAGYTLQGYGAGIGFSLYSSMHAHYVTIKNTNIKGFRYGLLLYSSSYNTVSENNITSNTYGIYLASSSSYNTVSENNITNDEVFGIWLVSSSYNTIFGNNITENNRGIRLDSSSYNTVSENNITKNDGGSGMLLYSSSYNTVSGNSVTENKIDGIFLHSSLHNTVSGNNVTKNYEYGISLSYSSDNHIFHNNFMDNIKQVYSYNSTNTWDDDYPSGGNFWSDYNGTDFYSGPYQNETGSDGIWDQPYIIDMDNQDHYPLVNPWTPTPDFSITASPTLLTIQQGNSDTSIITLTSIGGFNQPVQLSVSGAPSGVTATLNPEQVTPPPDGQTSSTLTVAVDVAATPGSYTLTVNGTNGTLSHSVEISLEVTEAQPDLEVSITGISKVNPLRGEKVTINATVTNLGDALGEVTSIELHQGSSYAYPIEPPIDSQNQLVFKNETIGTIEPGHSVEVTFTWYAVDIVNDDPSRRLWVKVWSDDPDKSNNVAYIDLEVDDSSSKCHFRIGEDAFSFSNTDVDTSEYFEEISQRLKCDFAKVYEPKAAECWWYSFRSLRLEDGICHGMSRASIMYYKYPSVNPLTKPTFHMEQEEILADLIKNEEASNFVVTFYEKWWKMEIIRTPFDLDDEFQTLQTHIDDNYPVIMRLMTSKKYHAVTVYDYYESGDNKSIVFYDPNFPGVAGVVVLDLANKRAFFPVEHLQSVFGEVYWIHIHARLKFEEH